jgi:hypothetical protein
LDGLVGGQIRYHEANACRWDTIARRLAFFAKALFAMTVLLVLFEVILPHLPDHDSHEQGAWEWVTLLVVIFPTAAATAFAFRAQTEAEVLAKTSEWLLSELEGARDEICAIKVNEPLASEKLGDALQDACEKMLSELEDWAILFDVKVSETA